MTPRSVIALAAAAAVSAAAAALAVALRPTPDMPHGESGPMLPGLAERLAEVRVIQVEGADDRVSLRQGEEAWEIEQRDGFPAATAKVRDLAAGLARLEKLEPRTRLPRHHARLHLDDIKEKGSLSKKVTLFDSDGRLVAGLFLGRIHADYGGEGQGGQYVRLPEEARVWLVRGQLSPPVRPVDWMNRDLLDLPPENVRRMILRSPDGAQLSIARQGGGFGVEDAPDGAVEKPGNPVASVARALAGLRFEDVRRADGVPFDPDHSTRVAVETTEGTVLRLTLAVHEEETWLRLIVEAAGQAPDVWRSLAARADGWVFKLAPFVADRFGKRLEDVMDLPEDTGESVPQ